MVLGVVAIFFCFNELQLINIFWFKLFNHLISFSTGFFHRVTYSKPAFSFSSALGGKWWQGLIMVLPKFLGLAPKRHQLCPNHPSPAASGATFNRRAALSLSLSYRAALSTSFDSIFDRRPCLWSSSDASCRAPRRERT